MKKTIASLFLAGILAVPVMAFAADGGIMPEPSDEVAGGIGKQDIQITNIDDTLNTIANYVIGVLIVMAVFYIIWAGYTFITSAGDAEKVGEARKRIMFAAIGVVVALLAKGIVSLVLNAMKGS